MTSAPRVPRLLLSAACLVLGSFVVSCPSGARAQEGAAGDSASAVRPMAPGDSAAVAAAMAASDSALHAGAAPAPTRSTARADRDRLEWGMAMPEGYFDWLGTLGYRHLLFTDARFEHWIHLEGTFGKKEYLTEGSGNVAWYVRPLALWRPEWRVRPVVEGGLGGYVVAQFADITGFGDWSSHARAFVKGHAVAGLETDLSSRLGLALRGRFTIPASRPLDYAQVVLFLR